MMIHRPSHLRWAIFWSAEMDRVAGVFAGYNWPA